MHFFLRILVGDDWLDRAPYVAVISASNVSDVSGWRVCSSGTSNLPRVCSTARSLASAAPITLQTSSQKSSSTTRVGGCQRHRRSYDLSVGCLSTAALAVREIDLERDWDCDLDDIDANET